MPHLARRTWTPESCEAYVQQIATETATMQADAVDARIDALIAENRQIHELDCINLNPATNIMNPKAEAALAAGLGSRPSLGYPGD
ncbi:MAG: serine hydroxymethyltransferase, partial [Rhodospirillales bacterium]|nr:serine hydroxymethyltransferase [Rhodospirillales bacterium]